MKIKTRLQRQGRVCHKKGDERGLWFERQHLEEVIKNKTERGKDCRFEKALLKSWVKWTETEYSRDSRE